MAISYETQRLAQLIAEQERAQAETIQSRQLQQYDTAIIPGQRQQPALSCAVTDLLRAYCPEERVSLAGVLRGMHAQVPDRRIEWVDFCGGRGVALREMKCSSDAAQWLNTTNVDLRGKGLDNMDFPTPEELEEKHPGITGDAAKPALIRADVETVSLARPANLITCVEALQYLDNPLATICNGYNQLADDGLFVVSSEHVLPDRIGYGPMYERSSSEPLRDMIASLDDAGIAYAIRDRLDSIRWGRYPLDPDRFDTMVLRKKPGTTLTITAPVTEVVTNYYMYKTVFYAQPLGNASLLEIVTHEAPL